MIVGIDLGTTNSLCAIWRDGKPVLVPNALGQVLTPSCVSLDDDGRVLVGRSARERLLTHPDRTAAAFKRYMGTDRILSLGDRKMRPEELSALVLKALKADAEAFLGCSVEEAIITVPAYFNDTQRKATRIAGELAGFKVERLLNEPTAAALAYGLNHADPETQFLVFDLGGGTFDVSILEMFSGVMEVRATAGDNFLGGEDFVDALIGGFLKHVGALTDRPRDPDIRKAGAHIRLEAERVKRALSSAPEATFSVRIADQVIDWAVSEAQFEQLTAPLVERLRVPVERAIRDSHLRSADLARIVLVGGATRMPIVHRLVARMFGRFPSRDINPDEAIALGAAVQAGLKAKDAALSEVVMTDVCPYTLGVEVTQAISATEVRRGLFLPVIERNTVVPASRSRPVYPVQDYQSFIEVRVFQGESLSVAENVLLGTLRIPLPPLPRAEQQVEVRFTYDVSGLLEVESLVKANNTKFSLVIERSPGGMTKAEVQQSLKALEGLKVHPREHSENRAVLARLERLYEQYLGEQREWLARQKIAFESVLERQEPREIADARAQLLPILDSIDRSPLA